MSSRATSACRNSSEPTALSSTTPFQPLSPRGTAAQDFRLPCRSSPALLLSRHGFLERSLRVLCIVLFYQGPERHAAFFLSFFLSFFLPSFVFPFSCSAGILCWCFAHLAVHHLLVSIY